MAGTDRSRMKQLILYVASRMRGAEFFGTTKLNKVLYRAEHAAYRELGHKLTSFRYQKNSRGPTLRAFVPVTREMADEGLISIDIRSLGFVEEHRVVPLAAPEMTAFSQQELQIIDREIECAWHLTAAQVSEEEHGTAAWYATRMGETIRPELSFVEDPGNPIPFSHEEEEWARTAIEQYLAGT